MVEILNPLFVATGNNFTIHEVKSSNLSGTAAAVNLNRKVYDKGSNIIEQESKNIGFVSVITTPITFGDIEISYINTGWLLKALKPVNYNNRVYQPGETISNWAYTKYIELLIVSGGVINYLLNKIKTLFNFKVRGCF